jgi:lysophospholipase L1-like esterase
LRTNGLGFRADRETVPRKPRGTVRVLATGDSHADGLVYNSESFATRLEEMLNYAGGNYEVVNGGTGGFGPQNYTGLLKRFLDLEPDAYVILFYTGNDFSDAVALAERRGELRSSSRPPHYHRRITRLAEEMPHVVGQALNQIWLFQQVPALRATALRITEAEIDAVRRICDEHAIGLFVVFLPSKLEVEPERVREGVDRAREELGLSEDDLGLSRRMTEEIARWMTHEGIAHLDLLDSLKGRDAELFWRSDLHLNVAGHRTVAEAIHASAVFLDILARAGERHAGFHSGK